MQSEYDIAYKAWRMNQLEQEPRKRSENGYAKGNDNAIKLTDNELDAIIERLKGGEKLRDIYEDTYVGIVSIEAIRARVQKRNIKFRGIYSEKSDRN
jgi:hypothetical protein